MFTVQQIDTNYSEIPVGQIDGDFDDFIARWDLAVTEHLSGEPALESPDYKGPYDELIKTLELAKQRAEEHRDHEHVWDEDCGFCLICFADGNA